MSSEWADTGGCGCNGKQECGYSDLTVAKCQQIWSKHVTADLLELGIAGFKLDQDDGGVRCYLGLMGRQHLDLVTIPWEGVIGYTCSLR